MDLTAFKYIKQSFAIFGRNIGLVIPPLFAAYFLYMPDNEAINLTAIMWSFMFLICYLPLAYGYLFELYVNHARPNFIYIFRKHWVNVVVVTIILFFVAFLFSGLVLRSFALQVVFVVLAKLSILYVIPMVYFNGISFNSVMLGFKCFFGNIGFNLPLVVLYFFPMFLTSSFAGYSGKAGIVIHMVVCMAEFSVNYVLFISAVLILKDKLIE